MGSTSWPNELQMKVAEVNTKLERLQTHVTELDRVLIGPLEGFVSMEEVTEKTFFDRDGPQTPRTKYLQPIGDDRPLRDVKDFQRGPPQSDYLSPGGPGGGTAAARTAWPS